MGSCVSEGASCATRGPEGLGGEDALRVLVPFTPGYQSCVSEGASCATMGSCVSEGASWTTRGSEGSGGEDAGRVLAAPHPEHALLR